MNQRKAKGYRKLANRIALELVDYTPQLGPTSARIYKALKKHGTTPPPKPSGSGKPKFVSDMKLSLVEGLTTPKPLTPEVFDLLIHMRRLDRKMQRFAERVAARGRGIEVTAMTTFKRIKRQADRTQRHLNGLGWQAA